MNTVGNPGVPRGEIRLQKYSLLILCLREIASF